MQVSVIIFAPLKATTILAAYLQAGQDKHSSLMISADPWMVHTQQPNALRLTSGPAVRPSRAAVTIRSTTGVQFFKQSANRGSITPDFACGKPKQTKAMNQISVKV